MKINLSPEDKIQFLNYYKLTAANIATIKEMKNRFGQTSDEIARKFNITTPDVHRVLNPPKNYGKWTAEEKLRHWVAGKKRAVTVKKNRDERRTGTINTR